MLSKTARILRPLLLTSVFAGGVLAILAPLGTGAFSSAGRFVYWIGLCLAGGLGAGAAEYGLKRFGKNLATWPLAAVQSVGATAAVSLFVFQIHHVPDIASAMLSLFYIWVVAMTICAVGALQKRRGQSDVGADPVRDVPPAIMSRLKPNLRGAELYALCAEDHYVRVITSLGEDLILTRLSDAILETNPLDGLAPHRSWWAARAGVSEVSRADGKARIKLKTGESVPVSRGRMKTLRENNWL